MRFYTGVGSRETPAAVLDVMRRLAKKLASEGWILRSGGARGADRAFESGASAKEIYRPEQATSAALTLAASVHPKWHLCSPDAKLLHARNCYQVLGANLNHPSVMLICWTPGGARVGGTATAIRLAEKYGVPIRNLARPEHMAAAMAWLESK